MQYRESSLAFIAQNFQSLAEIEGSPVLSAFLKEARTFSIPKNVTIIRNPVHENNVAL